MENSYKSSNSISSKVSDEILTVLSKSDNIEIMLVSETDEIGATWISFAKISKRIRRINERKLCWYIALQS